MHSNCLISSATAIINFASSIGFEALLQGIPICDPAYLTENSTIFSESDLVFRADSEEQVIEFIQQVAFGTRPPEATPKKLDQFLNQHVLAGKPVDDLFKNYERLILSTES